MPQLIGISGKAGSGKSTVGTYLETTYLNTYCEAFADPLKQACAAAFGIELEAFYDPERKEKIDSNWLVSPRKIAQFVGTEMFRELAGKLLSGEQTSFWVYRMALLTNGNIPTSAGAYYEDTDTIVIPDLRFQDEYDWILDNGGVVLRLSRNDLNPVGIESHQSEQGFIAAPNTKTFVIDNNGTLEELYDLVDRALLSSGIELFYNSPRFISEHIKGSI